MRRNQRLAKAVLGVVPVITLTALSGKASATTLIYEPFDYTSGSTVVGNTDTYSLASETWNQAGTSTTIRHVIATGSLTPPSGLKSAIGNMADLKDGDTNSLPRLNLPSTTGAATATYGNGSTLYYSLDLNIPTTAGMTNAGTLHTATSGNNNLLVGLNNSIGSQAGRPSSWGGELVIRNGAVAGTYNLGVRGSTTTNAYWSADLTAGQTYFVVVSGSLGSDGLQADSFNSLWVNPSSSNYGASSAPTADGTVAGTGGASAYVFKSVLVGAGITGSNSAPTDVDMDELRVGTTWADVTPTPTFYFDVNGAGAGSGVAANGTYTWEGSNWGTDGQGNNSSNAWVPGVAAVFAADQDSLGGYSSPNTSAYTVNLNSNETANTLVVNEGTVTFSGAGSLTVSNGLINVNNGVTSGGVAFTSTAVINNALNLGTNFVKAGSGALIVNGTASYSGTTTISGGTLQIGTGVTTGTIPAASVITNNGALVFDHSNDLTQGIDFDSTGAGISGSGNLVQAGTGNLILPIANTYKGITKATAGTLTVDNALAVQNSIVQTGAGGTIVFDPSLAGQSVTVGGLSSIVSGTDTGVAYTGPDMNLLINSVATNSAAPTTYSGVIGGATSITKQGSNPQTLSGANTYSGATNINVGSLGFANMSAMSANSAVTVSGTSDWTIPAPVVSGVGPQGQTANFTGGILSVSVTTAGSGNTWTNASSGAGSVGDVIAGNGPGGNSITWNAGGSLGLDVATDPTDLADANGGLTYAGNIGNFNGSNNNVGFMKRGFGVMTLTGSNNFTGQLKVNDDGGTLRLTTQLLNAGQSMATPTVYIGGATGATDSVHTQPVGTVLKILTNDALPTNSVINFGSGANSAKDFTQTTTFTSINAILRLHDAVPNTDGTLPSQSFNQTIAGITGGNGLVQAGGGTLTLNVPSGKSYSYTGTLETDASTDWQNLALSGGQRSGAHGVIIKNGTGEQDFNQNDGKFGGEFIMNAGSVGLSAGGVFGTGAGGSQLTINGGTLINKSGTSLNLRDPILQISGSFTWDINGNGDSQFLGLSGGSTIELTTDPTITMTSTVANGTGTLIFLGQVDDGTLYGNTGTPHGFTVTGSTSLTLENFQNLYRGNTVVSAGTLNLSTLAGSNNVPSLGDQNNPGTLVLATGGTLTMNGQNGVNFNSGIASSGYTNTLTNIENNPLSVTGDSTIAYTSSTASLTDVTNPAGVNFIFTSNSLNWTAGKLTFAYQNTAATTTVTYRPQFSGSGFTYGGPIEVDNGTGATHPTVLQFGNTSGTQTFNGNFTGTGSISRLTGGTTVLGGSVVSVGGVSIANSSLLQLAQSANHNHVIKTATLSIGTSGSQLDLTNNSLIVTGTAVGSWNGTAYSGIIGLIASGRGTVTAGQPAWNGSGIVTSMTSATASILTTLAVASAQDVKGITGAQTATFAGQTVHATDTLVTYTYTGDANLDGKIDADDYFQIDSNYNKNGNNAAISYHDGDFNYDGVINGDDYFIIDSNFAAQGSPFSNGATFDVAGGVQAVPEPASLGLLLAGGLLAGRRRRVVRT